MKYKILLITAIDPTTNRGGTAVFINNIEKYLRQRFDLAFHFIPQYLHIKHLPKRSIFFFYTLLKLPSIVSKYDLVFSHSPEASYIISFLGVPYVHIFHGNNNPVKHSKFWYAKFFQVLFMFFEKRIVKTASSVYTVGEQKGKLKKINTPVNLVKTTKKPVRSDFTFIGRLEPVKNVFRIIDIYSLLPQKVKKFNKLLIVGDGTLRKDLEAYVSKKKLEKNINFLGHLPNNEINTILDSISINIICSFHEGFPLSIAEALSHGVPVLSTNVGDIASVIKNEINGYCFNDDTPNSIFAGAIVKILANFEFFSKNATESSKIFNAEDIARSIINDMVKIIEE